MTDLQIDALAGSMSTVSLQSRGITVLREGVIGDSRGGALHRLMQYDGVPRQIWATRMWPYMRAIVAHVNGDGVVHPAESLVEPWRSGAQMIVVPPGAQYLPGIALPPAPLDTVFFWLNPQLPIGHSGKALFYCVQ
jgi:hypothetical protein